MQNPIASPETGGAPHKPVRLHYLDWLRVIAILGVFLFHAVHAFDEGDWHIKNADQSTAISVVLVLFSLWGMPLFFLIAGTSSWFALQRRTARQYATERFKRLLIPFIVGSMLFMPVMLYFEWMHKTATGALNGSFLDFVIDRNVGFSPRWFGSLGYHLWFLGFLFSFALLTIPLFMWLKGPSGQRFTSWMAQQCEHRGRILLFVIPIVVIQLSLRPFFPIEHDWADFFFLMSFFVLGYVLFADERFARAIRRDWWIILIAAIVALALILIMLGVGDPFDWAEEPSTPEFYLVWSVVAVAAFCWTAFALFIGMRSLDFTNAWLRYGQEAVLPFFVVHQPVIIVIAYFVVQWNTGIPPKLLTVVAGSLVLSLALYEFIIRRIGPLRAIVGMTPERKHEAQAPLSEIGNG